MLQKRVQILFGKGVEDVLPLQSLKRKDKLKGIKYKKIIQKKYRIKFGDLKINHHFCIPIEREGNFERLLGIRIRMLRAHVKWDKVQ